MRVLAHRAMTCLASRTPVYGLITWAMSYPASLSIHCSLLHSRRVGERRASRLVRFARLGLLLLDPQVARQGSLAVTRTRESRFREVRRGTHLVSVTPSAPGTGGAAVGRDLARHDGYFPRRSL